jgi:putative transcriptional regulator
MADLLDTTIVPPTHHPPAELLVDYAAGAMSDAEALLVGLHFDACPSCRRDAAAARALGGALLDAIAPAQLPPSLFESTLRAIGAFEDSHVPETHCPVPDFAAGWPLRLRTHLSRFPKTTWRWLPAGFRALRIPVDDELRRLWLMVAPAGRGPLSHRHFHEEWTVVLNGGFSDETGTYAAGDFAYMEAGEQHRVTAEPGEGCVGLILLRSNPEYLTFPGKLLAPLLRL